MDINKVNLRPRNGMDYIFEICGIRKQDVAKEFDVEPTAISNWRKRGIPKKYEKKLEEKFGIEIKYFNKELTPHEQLMLKNRKEHNELLEEAETITETIKDKNGEIFEIEATYIDQTYAQEVSYKIARRNMTFNMLAMLQLYEEIKEDNGLDFEKASKRVQLLESFIRLINYKNLKVEIIEMVIDALRDAEGLPRSDYGMEPRNEEFVELVSNYVKDFKNEGQQHGWN